MTLKEKIEAKIRNISTIARNFKIGKTGQTKQERRSDYVGFSSIDVVHSSSNRNEIIELEREMISKFRDYPNNKNESNESHGKMDDTGHYKLYVVYNLG